MSVKIIFSDIDGTFVTDEKKITPETAKAVKTLLEKNLKFVLVSARMPDAIYSVTDLIDLPRIPIISYSGGLVLTEDEKILYDERISPEHTKKVLAEIDRRWKGITVSYYAGKKCFVREIDENVQYEMNTTKTGAEVVNFDELIEKNILPNKIFVVAIPPVCAAVDRELGKIFPDLNVVRSSPYQLEIMNKGVSKADGIKVLLEHYGFKKDEAIAFGDNYNDVEMLKYIPQSVAMGNAPDDIKKIAHAVTDTNNNSGIYTYLVKAGVIES